MMEVSRVRGVWRRLFPRTVKRVQCQHLRAGGIYGDEIIAAGYARGWCPDCDTLLYSLPVRGCPGE